MIHIKPSKMKARDILKIKGVNFMLLLFRLKTKMKLRKYVLTLMMGLTLAGVVVFVQGCKKTAGEGSSNKSGSVALCVKCGQIKGSELCCKPDQTKCGSCDLTKGSPGCCKIPKDATAAAICTHCGQIKGGELCCKPDQATCDKCGLAKGSPGCCKLPKI